MSAEETRPGYLRRRLPSLQPEIIELPEPLELPHDPLHIHVQQLHQDVRSLRGEVVRRDDAARGAINDLQSDMSDVKATLRELQRAHVQTNRLLSRAGSKDRWAIGVIGMGILCVLLLRMYGMIGV